MHLPPLAPQQFARSESEQLISEKAEEGKLPMHNDNTSPISGIAIGQDSTDTLSKIGVINSPTFSEGRSINKDLGWMDESITSLSTR